eukprot:UN11273
MKQYEIEQKQIQMQTPQPSSIQLQLTQLLQRLMQKQQLFEQQSRAAVMIKSAQTSNENGGTVKVKVTLQISVPSQERQVSGKMLIWQRFIITF